MTHTYYRVICNHCGWNINSVWKLLAASLGLQHANANKHSQVNMDVIEVDAEKWCSQCEIKMRGDKWRMPDRTNWYYIWHCFRCRKMEFQAI